MIVENSIARAEDCFAVSGRIPCESYTRCNVVPVSWNAFYNSQGVLCVLRDLVDCRKYRSKFHVVPHSILQGEAMLHCPGILNKQSQGHVAERVVRIANPLDKDLPN